MTPVSDFKLEMLLEKVMYEYEGGVVAPKQIFAPGRQFCSLRLWKDVSRIDNSISKKIKQKRQCHTVWDVDDNCVRVQMDLCNN